MKTITHEQTMNAGQKWNALNMDDKEALIIKFIGMVKNTDSPLMVHETHKHYEFHQLDCWLKVDIINYYK